MDLMLACLLAGCSQQSTYCIPSGKPVDRQPAASPDAAASTSTSDFTYAFDSVSLGEATRDTDVVSATAWKTLGFDLDGLVTSARSCDVCTRVSGAPTGVQADGVDGIDNAFGSSVMPAYQALTTPPQLGGGIAPHTSDIYTTSIRAGNFTLQLRVVGLDQRLDQTGLRVEAFTSGAFDANNQSKPSFSMNEDWPVRDDIHSNPMIGRPFTTAYVANGRLVARDGDVVLMLVPHPGNYIDVRVHHAILAMEIQGTVAINGTLAGVLDPNELIDAARPFIQTEAGSFCGSAYDGIAQQLDQCTDILSDETNVPGRTCNAISFAIGFTAKQIGSPRRSLAPPSRRDRCTPPDAGLDVASDAGDAD
jgi:hypothetical protein